MTLNDAMVERVARIICRKVVTFEGGYLPHEIEAHVEEDWWLYKDTALDIITAMQSEGVENKPCA